jgi:hypothetical protein
MENNRLFRPVKLSDLPVSMLAAAVFGLALPASATAANGSNPAARTSAEYRDAVRVADKDYEAANRRCEVLATTARKLCVHDSAVARGAAIIEAQARRSPAAQAAR